MDNDKKNNPFVLMEEQVLEFWDRTNTFKQTLDKAAPQGDYVFYDGPPFATGTPHYGHIVASIMKDVVPRYETMRGYHVERKWGWDCHGLPIENIVEKELGTKTKKEIESLGVAKFNDLCRKRVLTYVDEWKKVITRLGRWADMENPYKTMDLGFMESIWWAFKKLWDNGLVYQDYRSMYVCPRCETTLSQSEVAEGYRDIKDLSVIAKFHLRPGQKWGNGKHETRDTVFILAWTTTPWTLIGNVALAVGEDISYTALRVKDAPELLIVASERLPEIFKDKEIEIVHKDIKGSDLVGLEYEPLFDYYYNDQALPNRENGWKVYAADFVTTTDGTGVVHIAPAFGEDDMNLGKAKKLPFIQHVGLDGVFKTEVKDFPGLHVKPIDDHTATDVEIIKYLAKHDALFAKEKYEHSYPHCWRCDTPLINYATSSWFVGVAKIKEELLENAKAINWSPGYLKEGRFGNWLEGARDWSISRQRFWASAIPIWECVCGERQVIGSVAELEERSGQKITDIHKDKVDPISFPCPKCAGQMKRIPDVIDCWFESGSMPFAQLHYPFENKEKFDNNFPAQFIAEGVDQTRAWFYYLHVISGGAFHSHSYRNVMVNGIVLAEDGKKMSKRLNNYPDPALVMDKYGSDALRAYLAAAPVMQAENLNFSEKGVEEALRKNVMVLWNVYKFYALFATSEVAAASSSPQVLDQWILAKLNQLIKEVTEAMEEYNLPRAMRPITGFIDELSTWYLRRSRERFKSEDENDKNQALATLKLVLSELAKVMAPFLPFVAESLWQKMSGNDFQNPAQSVHLQNWPEEIGEAENVLESMDLTRKIAEVGLAKRDAAGIKIRQMLSRASVKMKVSLPQEYLDLIKDELNVQDLKTEAKDDDDIELELDTVITPELRQEGLKRELIRFINLLRKEAGLNIDDSAAVYVSGADEETVETIDKLREEIKRETASQELEISSNWPKDLAQKEIDLNGHKVNIGLIKK